MYKGYGQIELSRTPIKFKVHSSHPLCGKSMKLSELSGYSFISVSVDSPIHQTLVKLCENAGFTPEIILNTNDILCYRKFLISGNAIGFGRCSKDDLKDNIKYLDIEGFELNQAVYAYYKEKSFKEIEPFINFIRGKSQK
jgi:DNA-binding transcriptional LysR family regulator